MSYKGQFDGWHGDENLCEGRCGRGSCSMCDEQYDMRCDEEYDRWNDLQANGG